MIPALQIHQHGASARLSVAAGLGGETRDNVLYATVTGLVTVEQVMAIRTRLAPAIRESQAVLLDYRRSLLAVTDAGLDALFRAAPLGPSALAMAWVVPDASTAEVWERQATRFALAGVIRFATHRIEEAQEWVRDQARRAALRQELRSVRP